LPVTSTGDASKKFLNRQGKALQGGTEIDLMVYQSMKWPLSIRPKTLLLIMIIVCIISFLLGLFLPVTSHFGISN